MILHCLFEGPKRLSELKRLVPDVSQKVLIQALREMEQHGIVHREIFKEVPPRVEYTATKLGVSLKPVIVSLCAWGRQHAADAKTLRRGAIGQLVAKLMRLAGGGANTSIFASGSRTHDITRHQPPPVAEK